MTLSRLTLVLASTLLLAQSAYATSIPNTDNPSSFVGPTLRGGFTAPITDTSGYSFAGEAGLGNFRLSGTFGWNILSDHNIKFSGEVLQQKITYGFFSENIHRYENQGALGGAYLFDINRASSLRPQFTLNAYYSHSSVDSLGTNGGTYFNSQGLPIIYTDLQRVAGANATGVSPGFYIQPWRGNRVGIDLNYDDVRYIMKYESQPDASGLGGTLHFNQLLTDTFGFNVSAGVRRPFNYYQAAVGWDKVPRYEAWALKLDGGYVAGKTGLPNTYNVMLAADYFLDRNCNGTEAERIQNDFLGWMAKPAVYMPEVLTRIDENVTQLSGN